MAACSGRGVTVGAGECKCDADYYGDSCELDATECRQSRCNGNGVCLRGGTCSCDFGFFGALCDQTAAECAAGRCSDHGSCRYVSSGCLCDAPYTGANCSTPVCLNGGSFSESTGECVCSATGAYHGPSCGDHRCTAPWRGEWNATSETCSCLGFAASLPGYSPCGADFCGSNGRLSEGNASACVCNPQYAALRWPVSLTLPVCRVYCPGTAAPEIAGDGITCICDPALELFGTRCSVDRALFEALNASDSVMSGGEIAVLVVAIVAGIAGVVGLFTFGSQWWENRKDSN